MIILDTETPFCPTTLVEWMQVLSGIGILFAAGTYYYNRKLKHAEWLKSLYEKFYENIFYKDARRWVDFDADYGLLKNALENDESHENQEKFADFLNFFGFIASLEENGQINLEEIKRIFGYYLNLIKSNSTCMEYISKYDYITLNRLLSKI